MREEPHPKEVYFVPLAKQRSLLNEPGQGRLTLGKQAGADYKRVRSRRREDLQRLEGRIKAWLE